MTKNAQQKDRRSKSKEQHGHELLTVQEVARKLRVDEATVRRWIKGGVLEAVSLPHQNERTGYRIRKSTLDAMLSGEVVKQ